MFVIVETTLVNILEYYIIMTRIDVETSGVSGGGNGTRRKGKC